MSSSNIKLPFGKSHAFIIGIDDYEHVTPLRTAANDSNEIATILREHHGFTVHGPLLNPGKDEMMRYLSNTMLAEVGKNDRIFMYFAGHGIALDGDRGPNGYLVPRDAVANSVDSLIPMKEVHDLIHRLPCKHGLLIFDCCFAGAFKWSSGYRDVVFDLPSIIYEERLFQYTQDPAWQVITSSACDQKAVDIMDNRVLGLREQDDSPNSPFAQALMDGLMGAADVIPADGGDGVITASELYTYLRDRVEDETTDNETRQTPAMFSLGKHDKGQFIFLHPKHRLNLPPMPKRNPFMGLKSYNEEDSLFFYGRDRVVKALAAKMVENPLTVVCGASGTGKSSVIKAGLVPLMRKQGWQILPTLRPGQEPMEVLRHEIPDIDIYLSDYTPTLLVIDQYEELVTQCLQTEDREEFENELAKWIVKYPLLRIVVTIRSDFETQFRQTVLEPWWKVGKYTIPVFSPMELREVIVKPTLQEVLFFEPPELVDVLINAVNEAPGALPLLSFTLSELYHGYINSGRTDRSLTLGDYEKLGGVIGALSMRANAIYDELDEDSQRSMRKFMLRMVFFDGEKNASRRVLEDQLEYSDPEETVRMNKIARQLVNARLLTSGIDEDGDKYFEPAHDALIRSWLRLQEWILMVGQSKLVVAYKLSLALADYREHAGTKKSREYLWNQNPDLQEILVDLRDGDHNLNAEEERFVSQSKKLRDKRKLQKNVLVISAMTTLLVAFGIALSLSISLKKQTIELKHEQLMMMASDMSRTSMRDLNIATKIALEIQKKDETSQIGHESLLKVAFKPRRGNLPYTRVDSIPKQKNGTEMPIPEWLKNKKIGKNAVGEKFTKAFPDGKRFMTVDKKGVGRIWDASGKRIFAFKTVAERSLELSGNENRFVSVDDSGTGGIYTNSGELLLTFYGNGEDLQYATLSPDQSFLLAISETGKLSIIDFEGKTELALSAESRCKSAIISDSSKFIYSEHDDGSYRKWDLSGSGNESLAIKNISFDGNPHAIAFSPDGERILIGGDEGKAMIDSVNGKSGPIYVETGNSKEITTVDFSPKGNTILAGGNDKIIRTWNSNGDLIGVTDSLWESVRKARFSPDGNSVVSISYTQLSVFDLQGKLEKKSVYYGRDVGARYHYHIRDFDLSPSGDTLVTVTPYTDGARRWSFKTHDFGEPLNGVNNQKLGESLSMNGFTSISPDGRYFLIGNPNKHEFRVFNRFEESSFISGSYFVAPFKALFSPDNHFIICAYVDGAVKIWNISGEEVLTFFPHKGELTDIAMDPKGRYFATCGKDSKIRVWPLAIDSVRKKLGALQTENLTLVEKIVNLKQRIEEFDPEDIRGDALLAGRYLSQYGRISEAKKYYGLVEEVDSLTVEEKHKFLKYNAKQFLNSKNDSILLRAARLFHLEGKTNAAKKLFEKAKEKTMEKDSNRVKFTVAEKIQYLGYEETYFDTVKNKQEVLDAARYYIAKDSLLGQRLFEYAEELHGECNWKAFYPAERAQYLGYDMAAFFKNNLDQKDLIFIKEYYIYQGDSLRRAAEDSVAIALERIRLASE